MGIKQKKRDTSRRRKKPGRAGGQGKAGRWSHITTGLRWVLYHSCQLAGEESTKLQGALAKAGEEGLDAQDASPVPTCTPPSTGHLPRLPSETQEGKMQKASTLLL